MCGYTDRTRTRTVKRLFSLTFTLSGVVLLLIILGGKIDDTALAGSPPQVSPPDQLTFSPVDVDTDATLAATTAITGSKPWIWILCKFSDIATEPQNLTYFQNLHASLDTYFREVSYNKANIAGSDAKGWYTLPHTLTYYAPGTSGGRQNAARDCTSLADADVDFTEFYGLNLMFNGELLGSSVYGMTDPQYLTLDGVTQWWPTIFLDSKGSYNMALSAHEMYHGFGLGHSSAYSPTTQEVLGSSWDPIGIGACGFSSCTPSHLVAPQKEELAWITPTHIYTAAQVSQTVTLEALAQPQTDHYLMVKIPLGSSPEHYYTLEARRPVGSYDGKLPGATVLIHEVNRQDPQPFGPYSNGHIRLVPRLPNFADQPWGTGAMWTAGHVFSDTTIGITVTVLSATTTGFTVRVNIRPAVTTTLYVDTDATGANNGTSWANAYTHLQDALAAANPVSNDVVEIWVAEGTYTPTTGLVQTAAFQLKDNVKIYGGFAAIETARSQRNVSAHATILSGDLLGNDNSNLDPSEPTRADNSYHVVTSSGTDASAVLDGFIVTSGNANGSSYDRYGGGLYNKPGDPTLNHVTFRSNTAAQSGGGLFNYDGNPALSNVMFVGNLAAYGGGGLYNLLGNPTLVNIVLSGNIARYLGGGVYNYYGDNVKLTNVTFVSNTANYYGNSEGGGIYNYSSTVTIANTILWGNRDHVHGTAAAGQLTGNASNSFAVTYSLVQGGYTGAGNISSDPLFVDADGPDNTIGTADDNVRLQDTSPAIDAGDNDAVPTGITTDLDGNSRFYDHPRADTGHGASPIVDLGAFEKISTKVFLPIVLRNASH